MNETLGANVFDYGQKAAADQMRTSWEKVTEYVGTMFGQDISNELQIKVTVTLAEPAHNAGLLARHKARETVVRAGQANIQAEREARLTIWETAVAAGMEAEAPMRLAVLYRMRSQMGNSKHPRMFTCS